MKTILRVVCLIMFALALFAQDRGTLTGTVSDPAGAIVAKLADTSRAWRRVSIPTRLLFHHDARIGYSRAKHLVQHHVGLLDTGERTDDDAVV